MALAVLLSNLEIVTIEETTSPTVAATKADASRRISGRNFRQVDRNFAGVEYDVFKLDSDDLKLLSDTDRYYDPKYVNYVVLNCKHVASFIGQR